MENSLLLSQVKHSLYQMWFSEYSQGDDRQASRSSQAQRNPLLLAREEDQPAPSRYSKARVDNYQSETKYLSERPRGLAKGAYSEASQGTYTVGREPEQQYKPSRKPVEVRVAEDEQYSSKKKQVLAPAAHNPILQDDARFEPEPPRARLSQDWRPSVQTEVANQRKHLLPSQIGISVQQSHYSKRNQSSVFGGEEAETPATYGKRNVAGPHEHTHDLLQYKYALPYRDNEVSAKPSEVLMRTEDVKQAAANLGMAEVYRAKTNLSRVKF